MFRLSDDCCIITVSLRVGTTNNHVNHHVPEKYKLKGLFAKEVFSLDISGVEYESASGID